MFSNNVIIPSDLFTSKNLENVDHVEQTNY